MSADAFLALAQRQIRAPVRARQRATETRARNRARRAEEKALAERDTMLRLWKHRRREELEAALIGPQGPALERLISFLNTMTLESAATLLQHVRDGGWTATDPDTRFLALHLANEAIVRLREQAGLPPFD